MLILAKSCWKNFPLYTFFKATQIQIISNEPHPMEKLFKRDVSNHTYANSRNYFLWCKYCFHSWLRHFNHSLTCRHPWSLVAWPAVTCNYLWSAVVSCSVTCLSFINRWLFIIDFANVRGELICFPRIFYNLQLIQQRLNFFKMI